MIRPLDEKAVAQRTRGPETPVPPPEGGGTGGIERASDGRAGLPLGPAHVPAVEAVVGGDRLVAGVLDDDHVTDQRVAVEPGRRRVRVVRALLVLQTDAAVAGVDAAEDGRGTPVVAVDEGA